MISPEEELDLVKRALLLGQTVSGCCEWHEGAFQRVLQDPELLGMTPAAIRQLSIESVSAGGTIQQVREQRPQYNDYDFYYKVVVAVPRRLPRCFPPLRRDAHLD